MNHDLILDALAASEKFVKVDNTLYIQYDTVEVYRKEREVTTYTELFKPKHVTKTEYGPLIVDFYLKGELVKRLDESRYVKFEAGDTLTLSGIKGFMEINID